jgi:hypothetical protein
MELPDGIFKSLAAVGFLLVGLLTIVTFIFRKPDVLTNVFRAIMLQLGFWSCFALDSLMGITRNLVPMEAENLGWGMILITCWFIMTAVSALGILGTAMRRVIAKISQK